ncbi:hypothetical protein M9434_006610 [Picochlorum sp. BPE23]|nr:hypothetical protein M9434_006610 [Picochlorum sp. BPE23]
MGGTHDSKRKALKSVNSVGLEGSQDRNTLSSGDGDGVKVAKKQRGAKSMTGSGRRAAQNHDFDESKMHSCDGFGEKMKVVLEKECKNEVEVLEETGGVVAVQGKKKKEVRRIHDFCIVDAKGHAEPLESLEFMQKRKKKMMLSGIVYPEHGAMEKAVGRRVAKPFGPVTGYSVVLSEAERAIVVCTSRAEYRVVKPAAVYKKSFENLDGQAAIAHQVYHAIKSIGMETVGLDHVIAHLARCKVTKDFSSPREGLLINGSFVLEQLKMVDERISSCGFYTELKEEVSRYMYKGRFASEDSTGIVIQREGSDSAVDAQEIADQQYAMQLQAKMDREVTAGRNASRECQEYIKVNEEEIAGDYPLPMQYVKEEEELDEFILYDEELEMLSPEEYPKRVLTQYSIYNADGFLSSLELLPMWSGVDPDVALYASGIVVEDSSGDCQVAAMEGGGSSGAGGDKQRGMRMSLSQIREWVVELGPDMVFISIRTDIGWYSLLEPAAKYKPWADVVMKCAHMAASTLQMVTEESRASRLSYNDIVKRLCAVQEESKAFVSNKHASVDRFLSVHAQIFLSCFEHFPSESVRKCAFVMTLKEKLNSVKHSKLYVSSSRGRGRGTNRNPMKDRAAGTRAKPMTATATAMVKSVWQSYFASESSSADGSEEVAHEVEEDENEDIEDESTETALANQQAGKQKVPGVRVQQTLPDDLMIDVAVPQKSTAWILCHPMKNSNTFSSAKIGSMVISLGDCVYVNSTDNGPTIGLVQALFEKKNTKMIQIRILKQGCDTVLGDAASEEELFLTQEVMSVELRQILGKVNAKRRDRVWDVVHRIKQFHEDTALRKRNEQVKHAKKGSLEFFWSKEYVPEEGMFKDASKLDFGNRLRESEDEEDEISAVATDSGVMIDEIEYSKGQFVYVYPDVFDQMPEANKEYEVPKYLSNARYHKGSYDGLRAWGIGRLVKVGKQASKQSPKPGSEVDAVVLQRFWRPEDISIDLANKATSYYDIYAGNEEIEVDTEDIVGPVNVGSARHPESKDTFICVGSFDRKKKAIKAAPKEFAATAHAVKSTSDGKGKDAEEKGKSAGLTCSSEADPISLSTMDIFAGCGGLSEGMHQAKAAVTKWAIEYEEPAAESFKLNNPEAAVFCNNCNVLLHAAMVKAGQEADCMASEEAVQGSNKLTSEEKENLPRPGEVDFICGGPPCQGYSGMNRFNKGNWSMVQNSMVMAFLSYADFYRPRYFLLENVRNFVSHNKSFTFRLTLRSLLDMGYQVRFGVLNAGNFGVSQSRKRTFIWAAAPQENLPSWPRLMHCFRTPQLTIKLPGDVQYTAVPQTDGAPLRPVTVHDAISDLPPITNGHDSEVSSYSTPPSSAFQIAVRGNCDVLYDHVCKYMNELNMERCRCIPKNCPGADWRVLEEIVAKDPSRKVFKSQPLVPWCLPNTADRHNGWRGLFGRLDWSGHFPTSTTDPQPMGKVGQVFHPEQDRIVSVRECARAQGFPDRHRFVGNVQNKHRQVGNAVPPPLAAALGRELRKALEEKEAMLSKKMMKALEM